MRSEYRETAAEAFARINWRDVVLPRLLKFAGGCMRVMGWTENKSTRPAVMEAQEMVNEVVLSFLEGDREWPAKTRTEEEILAVLCMAIWSVTTNRRASAAVVGKRVSPALIDKEIQRETTEGMAHARQAIGQIVKAIEDDAEMLAFVHALGEGATTREELASALGWDEKHVKLVRGRMSDRLSRRGITKHALGDG
jgi:hypothetical protein